MEQLTGLDASFLYLETENAPMHIGGLSILNPATSRGPLTFESFRAYLASRIERFPAFRRRLEEVPLQLGKPYWVEDADFDLDSHLERTQLPEPGGWTELRALMAWEMGRHLDRRRPLWEVLFVEGLDRLEGVPAGSIGLISRMHHAAIDGVSGAEILGALFDPSPEPVIESAASPDRPPAAAGERRPSRAGLLLRAGTNLLRTPIAVPGTLARTARGLAGGGAVLGLKKVKPPPFPFTAPRTRLNAPISGRRVWGGAEFSLDRIKGIRERVGASVNDVVLAICSGALRVYLSEKEELPKKPLVAMVPVSVRAREEKDALGNQVSAMLISLATDRQDPLDRLEAITGGAGDSKIYHQAVGAKTLTDYAQFIPFSLAALAARLYGRMHLADRHAPVFNLVITNVPGPQMPLYVNGAPLLSHLGAAPVLDGMGLILPVFSYAGKITISALSCPRILPDLERFLELLRLSLEELEASLTTVSALPS